MGSLVLISDYHYLGYNLKFCDFMYLATLFSKILVFIFLDQYLNLSG